MKFVKVNPQTSGDLSVDSFCGEISMRRRLLSYEY